MAEEKKHPGPVPENSALPDDEKTLKESQPKNAARWASMAVIP
jgi:hypothetical protein